MWAVLEECLVSADATLRAATAGGFIRASAAQADVIHPLLGDPEPRVRLEACRTLMKLDGARFESAVWASLLDDPDDAVRSTSFFALRDHGALTEPRLVHIVRDPALGALRPSAAYEIRWRPEHAELLGELLDDPDENLRRIAMNAIGSLH